MNSSEGRYFESVKKQPIRVECHRAEVKERERTARFGALRRNSKNKGRKGRQDASDVGICCSSDRKRGVPIRCAMPNQYAAVNTLVFLEPIIYHEPRNSRSTLRYKSIPSLCHSFTTIFSTARVASVYVSSWSKVLRQVRVLLLPVLTQKTLHCPKEARRKSRMAAIQRTTS